MEQQRRSAATFLQRSDRHLTSLLVQQQQVQGTRADGPRDSVDGEATRCLVLSLWQKGPLQARLLAPTWPSETGTPEQTQGIHHTTTQHHRRDTTKGQARHPVYQGNEAFKKLSMGSFSLEGYAVTSLLGDKLIFVRAKVKRRGLIFMIDSGATSNFIDLDQLRTLG